MRADCALIASLIAPNDLLRRCVLWPVRWLLYTHCPGGDEDEARHQRLVEEAERRVECERRVERESGGAESASAPITAPTAEAMSEGHPNMEGTAVHHIRVEEAIEEDSKAEDEKWVALELREWARWHASAHHGARSRLPTGGSLWR